MVLECVMILNIIKCCKRKTYSILFMHDHEAAQMILLLFSKWKLKKEINNGASGFLGF